MPFYKLKASKILALCFRPSSHKAPNCNFSTSIDIPFTSSTSPPTTSATMSSGFHSTGLNYPLLAIPAYYIFSLTPHVYAGSILKASGYKPNNANPKASFSPSAVKGKVPEDVFGKYQRAENVRPYSPLEFPLASHNPAIHHTDLNVRAGYPDLVL